MALPPATYDLVMILDPQADADARAKIVADTRASIEGAGALERHDDWGERALAYPIDRRATGEYHLLQFHPDGAKLLSDLDRTLHITDGVLRHRIIKLAPGVPSPPEMGAAAATRRGEGEARAPAEEAATGATEEAAEAPGPPAEVAQAPPTAAVGEAAPAEDAPAEDAPAEGS
jgi:small subunit ribosomal protein S6